MQPDFVTVECWENQRWMPTTGWGTARLPTDRPLWSDKKGSRPLLRAAFLLPSAAQQWTSEWRAAPNGPDGPEGWYYGVDFTVPTRYCTAKQGKLSFVRRRRWVRSLTGPAVAAVVGAVSSDSSGVDSPTAAAPPHRTPSALIMARAGNAIRSGADGARECVFYGFYCNDEEAIQRELERQHVASAYFSAVILSDPTLAAATTNSTTDSTAVTAAAPSTPSANTPPPSIALKSFSSELVYVVTANGLPNLLRPKLWFEWSGAAAMKQAAPSDYFTRLLDAAKDDKHLHDSTTDINQDIKRTAASHPFFDGGNGTGAHQLRLLLVTWQKHSGGAQYHQAYSYVAAVVLLNATSLEDAFWLLEAVIGHEGLVSTRYLDGRLVDRDVERFGSQLAAHMPREQLQRMQQQGIDLSLVAYGWLQALLCAHLPIATACRVFDAMFVERSSAILVKFAVAVVRGAAQEIAPLDDIGSVANHLNAKMRALFDPSTVFTRLASECVQPK